MNPDYARQRARNVARGDLPADDPRHGTVNGYGNLGCRCPRCTSAWKDRIRESRASRRARLLHGDGSPEHGTVSTYLNWGCRCELCRAAKRSARRRSY